MSLERITELLPVPETPVENQDLDWDDVEARFGRSLPDVYKEFVSTYGSGSIADFLWVLNPFSPNPSLNFDQALYFGRAYESLQSDFPEDFPRSTDEFFTWAFTDNGDSIVWLLDQGDPNEWLVRVHGPNPSNEQETGLNTQGFLETFAARKLTSSILPDDFSADEMRFAPRK